jgi:hypothetical protein
MSNPVGNTKVSNWSTVSSDLLNNVSTKFGTQFNVTPVEIDSNSQSSFVAFLDDLSIDVSYDYVWVDASLSETKRRVDAVFDLEVTITDISGVFTFHSDDIVNADNADDLTFNAVGSKWKNGLSVKSVSNGLVSSGTGAQLKGAANTDLPLGHDSATDNGVDTITLRHIAYNYFKTVNATRMFLNDASFCTGLVTSLNTQLNDSLNNLNGSSVTKSLLQKMIAEFPDRFLNNKSSYAGLAYEPVPYGSNANLPFEPNDQLVFFIRLHSQSDHTHRLFNAGTTSTAWTPADMRDVKMPELVYAVRITLTLQN